jgi:hypothetical protein
MWLLAWFLALHLLWTIPRWTKRIPINVRALSMLGCTAILVGLVYSPVRGMWRRERAAALEGDLVANRAVSGSAILEIGDSNTRFFFAPGISRPQNPPEMQFVYDAGLKLEETKEGLSISTPIRDRNGHLVVSVVRNHWTVYPPYFSDKNYSRNTLEVLDDRGHVVFQTRLLPDRVEIQGEWYDDYGRGIQVMKSLDPKRPGAFFTYMDRSRGVRNENVIPPIFLYPSKDHLGELRNQGMSE